MVIRLPGFESSTFDGLKKVIRERNPRFPKWILNINDPDIFITDFLLYTEANNQPTFHYFVVDWTGDVFNKVNILISNFLNNQGVVSNTIGMLPDEPWTYVEGRDLKLYKVNSFSLVFTLQLANLIFNYNGYDSVSQSQLHFKVVAGSVITEKTILLNVLNLDGSSTETILTYPYFYDGPITWSIEITIHSSPPTNDGTLYFPAISYRLVSSNNVINEPITIFQPNPFTVPKVLAPDMINNDGYVVPNILFPEGKFPIFSNELSKRNGPDSRAFALPESDSLFHSEDTTINGVMVRRLRLDTSYYLTTNRDDPFEVWFDVNPMSGVEEQNFLFNGIFGYFKFVNNGVNNYRLPSFQGALNFVFTYIVSAKDIFYDYYQNKIF